eukprot:TRINITY_DN100719_c0_g1_i1.p1 TRINITY_DN100719_c0_g1~~TRINITY_DN100719_c0_g1_i1.p1  ORF type:complete len:241 (-),score=44.19 TRINITY_DN100719_c0_g1_i1:158-880(-)
MGLAPSTSKNVCGSTMSYLGPDIGSRLHQYVLSTSLRMTKEQASLMKEIDTLEKPIMAGAQDEAQFLAFLCETLDAKKVLEIGVFRGSTTLALALALPENGKVVGLDVSDEYAQTGKKYWEQSGVASKIDFRVGDANESLDKMLAPESGESAAGTFDLAFIDADKINYDQYYEKSLKLVRKGGIVAVDNTFWHGSVLKPPEEQDEHAKSISTLNAKLLKDERISLSMLSIADGLTLCRKR